MEDYELILGVYCEETQAAAALSGLKNREQAGELRLFNAAVLSKDEAGRTFMDEDQDIKPGVGSIFGAVVGGLVGLLGGPAGAVVGAAAGAAAGGLAAGATDLGFEDKFLKQIQATLLPGSSALLLLAESRYAETICAALEPTGGKLLRHVLRSEVIERLRASLDE